MRYGIVTLTVLGGIWGTGLTIGAGLIFAEVQWLLRLIQTAHPWFLAVIIFPTGALMVVLAINLIELWSRREPPPSGGYDA